MAREQVIPQIETYIDAYTGIEKSRMPAPENLRRPLTFRNGLLLALKSPFLLLQMPLRYTVGQLVRDQILPARDMFKDQRTAEERDAVFSDLSQAIQQAAPKDSEITELNNLYNKSKPGIQKNVRYYSRYVVTQDKAVLKTYDIEPIQTHRQNDSTESQKIKHILFFQGNAMEAPDSLANNNNYHGTQLAGHTNCRVTCFNYRGVRDSSEAVGIKKLLPTFDDFNR